MKKKDRKTGKIKKRVKTLVLKSAPGSFRLEAEMKSPLREKTFISKQDLLNQKKKFLITNNYEISY